MNRIFLTLAVLANGLLSYAVWRGMSLGDAAVQSPAVQHQVGLHIVIGLGALIFATLVHAVALTWFMGTGRFLEETTRAYSISSEFYDRSRQLKYRMLPGMTLCLLLLIATGALGAVADPATPVSLDGTLGLSGARIHLVGAVVTVLANLVVNVFQFRAICGNSFLIDAVLAEVRCVRAERGLSNQ